MTDSRLEPRERYHRDPMFHSFVDLCRYHLVQCTYTPTELREAVILACILHEEHTPPKAILMKSDGSIEFLDPKVVSP